MLYDDVFLYLQFSTSGCPEGSGGVTTHRTPKIHICNLYSECFLVTCIDMDERIAVEQDRKCDH